MIMTPGLALLIIIVLSSLKCNDVKAWLFATGTLQTFYRKWQLFTYHIFTQINEQKSTQRYNLK